MLAAPQLVDTLTANRFDEAALAQYLARKLALSRRRPQNAMSQLPAFS